ncbi:AAA family ATPase [Nonomuraea sp. NPDC050556]|uniref:AAA family ATPase n=1 Tax=Nonomuraea sp. NPDC050556 TaxID=3364369 RepID=UPI0037AEB0C1
MTLPHDCPHFLREVCGTLPVHSQYVLHGNIRDKFLFTPPGEPGPALLPVIPALRAAMSTRGYDCVLVYDTADQSLRVDADTAPAQAAAQKAASEWLRDVSFGKPYKLTDLVPILHAVAGPNPARRAAVVVDYASRIAADPAKPGQEERAFFRFAEKLSHLAQPVSGAHDLFNPVIWLVDGERDLPPWMLLGNERIRSVGIPIPDFELRMRAAALEASALGMPDDDPKAAEIVKTYAEQTDGMTLSAIQEVRILAQDRGTGVDGLAEAIRVYKFGVERNPWRRDHLHGLIKEGETAIPRRVRGQVEAVTKTLDILKRAALGLSGAQATSTATRPRGALFFAGPTGVGKTELAKGIAVVLFGRGTEPLRFDMSEFSAEQSADRLIGAPPGYVGYEAGGELTGAVRRDPFRVILFDEIDKAHPKILDKFLQILEDGRLTDGQGVTTYFSECVLVFTSNLGIMIPDPADPTGRRKIKSIGPDDSYLEMNRKVSAAIKEHFLIELGRPELLNRFGDNIVVFRSIDKGVASEIFDIQLENVIQRVRDTQRVEVTVDPAVELALRKICTTDEILLNGGRGVGNTLESCFINPLGRALFDGNVAAGSSCRVVGLKAEDGTYTLVLS